MVKKEPFNVVWLHLLILRVGKSLAPLQPPEHDIEEMAAYLGRQMPQADYNPLGPGILPRDGKHNDYQDVSWHSLLAGDREACPSLSIAKSERSFLEKVDVKSIKIPRRYDIDSFFGVVNTLAVHTGGFSFAYNPQFLRRISQNPYLRFKGHKIQRLKQLRLGQGRAAGGYGYNCHVLFPNMPVASTTHLTQGEQERWIDSIVLPALRRTCPNDCVQHHPRSYRDALCKANVKKEFHPHGLEAAIEARYDIPEEYQRAFWTHACNLCSLFPEFADPVLLISGHNLKLVTKRDSVLQARNDFWTHLNQCFILGNSEDDISADDFWFDLGMEDTPSMGTDQPGVTLLRKTSCLEHWSSLFSSPPHMSTRTDVTSYRWAMTRDAGTATVQLKSTNAWRKRGMAYHKAYNLQKDLFATPLKPAEAFANIQLEALGYSQELLDRWYQWNNQGREGPYPAKRQQLIGCYQAIKQRVSIALSDSRQTNFGVRQEYRINLALFESLEKEDDNEDCSESAPDGHRPFWMLSTEEVNNYLAKDVTRWLWILEVLISQVLPGLGDLSPVTQEQQMLNGALVSTVIRSLALTVGGGDPSRSSALWRDSWTRQVPTPPEENQESDGETSEVKQVGLRYKESLENHGMIWLPSGLLTWDTWPAFAPEVLGDLAVYRNAFQKSFKHMPDIQKKLKQENRFFASFRSYLKRARIHSRSSPNLFYQKTMHALNLGAELIIQAFIKDIFSLLAGRFECDVKNKRARKAIFLKSLEEEEASGLAGLDYGTIEALLPREPNIALAKGAARHANSHFEQYKTGLWRDKLMGLFLWDDNPAGSDEKKRGWDNMPFRRLVRSLHSLVRRECDNATAEKFLGVLKTVASQKIWIIPQYDIGKISGLRKALSRNDQDSGEAIESLSELDRTNWLMPQLPEAHFETLKRVEHHLDLEVCNEADFVKLRSVLSDPGLPLLTDKSCKTRKKGLPLYLSSYGCKMTLLKARAFWAELETSGQDSG